MSATAIPSNELQQANASALQSFTRRLLWSVRRELWEFPSIYVAPLIVVALVLVGSLISMARTALQMRDANALNPMQQHELIQRPYDLAALFLMGITFLISIFYCLEAMQTERRDRSILFWKSLPVSDVVTVLSKMSIPVIVLPVIAVVLTIVTHVIMVLLNALVLKGAGQSADLLWSHVALGQMWEMMLYHMLVLHGLWFAPFYGWLLLVSAWARRLAFLWAALPFVVIGVFEKMVFNSTGVGQWLMFRFGSAPASGAYPGGNMGMHEWSHFHLSEALLSLGLWTGLAFAALCVFAAARTRRSRGPM
jgi:ABC-2 type transport system permease protein